MKRVRWMEDMPCDHHEDEDDGEAQCWFHGDRGGAGWRSGVLGTPTYLHHYHGLDIMVGRWWVDAESTKHA